MWSVVRNDAATVTVTHNQNNLLIDVMSHAEQNTSGTYLTKSLSGVDLSNQITEQTNNFVIWGSLDRFNSGISATGTKIMYITFRIPDNNILI